MVARAAPATSGEAAIAPAARGGVLCRTAETGDRRNAGHGHQTHKLPAHRSSPAHKVSRFPEGLPSERIENPLHLWLSTCSGQSVVFLKDAPAPSLGVYQ